MPDFPSNIGFSKVDPLSHSPAYINEPNSLKTIAVATGTQRWEFELTTKFLKALEFRQGWAFLNARGGQAFTFDVRLPEFSKPLGAISGAVKSLGAYAIGTKNIALSNFTPAVGDFIRFAGHRKVYQVESATGNNATIYPPLFEAVNLNEVVIADDVPFTVRLTSKVSKLKLDTKKITKLKFKCIEAF